MKHDIGDRGSHQPQHGPHGQVVLQYVNVATGGGALMFNDHMFARPLGDITTLRVEGLSVGSKTLKALSTSVACPGFKFVSTFDVSPGSPIVTTRMTSALLRQQWLHNPFVPPTAIQWDAA